MRTLQNREELTDQIWEMLLGSRDERGAMEAIRALEYNYRQIDRLKYGKGIKAYEDDVPDQLLAGPKRIHIREECSMTSEQERKHCGVIGPVIFIVVVAFLAVVAFGCRTVKGAADGFMLDGQAMFNYAVDHKDSSTQLP